MKTLLTNRPPISRRQVIATAGSVALGALHHSAKGQTSTSAASPIDACSPAPVPIPNGFNGKTAFGPHFQTSCFIYTCPGLVPNLPPSSTWMQQLPFSALPERERALNPTLLAGCPSLRRPICLMRQMYVSCREPTWP